jgi:restriction system protein
MIFESAKKNVKMRLKKKLIAEFQEINEELTQIKEQLKHEIQSRIKETESRLIAGLNNEGFSGLEGAIELRNLNQIDDAILVYKDYLKSNFDLTDEMASNADIVKMFRMELDKLDAQKNEETKNRLLKELTERCQEIVWEHKSTLIKKHKQLIVYDDYGKKITTQWQNELVYFLKNIVQKDEEVVDLRARLNCIPNSSGFSTSGNDEAVDWFNASEVMLIGLNAINEVIACYKPDDTAVDISNISPSDFEQLCADILIDNGWTAKVNGKTGDQGVDVIAEKDNRIVAIQCKLYSIPVGNSAVQEVFSGMRHHYASHAVVVSNQTFTKSAKQLSMTTGVLLLHYSELNSLDKMII